MNKKIDFSKGPVWKCIMRQAIPLTIAQIVHLLYNIVDRIYIGHLGEGNSLALTGIGLTFPLITVIMAFTALFGNGGVPLFSMERGAKNEEKAARILGNAFSLLLISGIILMILGYIFLKPVMFALGASPDSFVYAKKYMNVYLAGTIFSMFSTGLNGYINAQGFAKTGMLSVIIGAASNILLDPLFIFVFDMGVSGAALATIISQLISSVWVLSFLTGKKAVIPLRKAYVKISAPITRDIVKLGTANFIMQGTTCAVQIACNSTLQTYGGDIYVGIMTVANSVREMFMLPLNGVVNGSQPVISYNYGAKNYKRVRSGINFNTVTGTVYTLIAWIIILIFPEDLFRIFSDDMTLTRIGPQAMTIYFFGFVFMAFQFAGQSTFQALGDAKHAIIFSLLRKVIIVLPLTLILPAVGFGVNGVFLAEPVSNIIGGIACYTTMRLTVSKRLN